MPLVLVELDPGGGERRMLGPTEPPVLTPTEVAIVTQLAGGHCSKEIAVHLRRSRATIEFHVRSLFVKLNARSRAQIVARAFDAGILLVER